MGAIGGPLGLNGGAAGSGFQAPGSANLTAPIAANQNQNAYNQTQNTMQSQQALLSALQAQNGLGNQNQVYGQGNQLLGQLQGVASGQGPNPAQAMLNQQTGANVANQAALMAGQRGAGANVGLMARQAAQQGAATQQQAVGQGATMQANQSLGALGQMQGVLGQQAGVANTMAANQIGQTNANTAAAQQQQQALLNAIGGYNNAQVGMQSSINQGNTALAGQEMKQGESAMGGAAQGGGSMMTAMMAGGGAVGQPAQMATGGSAGPQSSLGKFLTGANSQQSAPNTETASAKPMQASGGGMVDVVLSPGEKVVAPEKVSEAAGGKIEAKTVPGKAKVPGDSTKNDVVKTKLPEGSVVVPRTKAKDKKDSADFVRKTLAKRRGK